MVQFGPLLPSVRNREIVKLSLNIGRLKKKIARYEGMIVDDKENMGAQELIMKIEKSLKVLQVFPQL